MATPTVAAPKRLWTPVQLTTSYVTEYTVPSGVTTKITSLFVVNTSAAAATLYLHFVISGGSADTTNAVVYAISIPADGLPVDLMDYIGESPFLNAADFISAKAGTATAITLHGSGVELS